MYKRQIINNFIFSENTLHDERYSIIYLGIAIIVRLLAHYIQESVANRLGSAVKATFRERALEHMFKLGVQHKERHGDVIPVSYTHLDVYKRQI